MNNLFSVTQIDFFGFNFFLQQKRLEAEKKEKLRQNEVFR